MPTVDADAVTVSHQHYDHNALNLIGGNPVIIDKDEIHDLHGVEINSIKSFHDE